MRRAFFSQRSISFSYWLRIDIIWEKVIAALDAIHRERLPERLAKY